MDTKVERQRDLARDIRDGKEGEVMATPDEWQKGARGKYWLRPVGGGEEWPVPRQFVQIIERGQVAA